MGKRKASFNTTRNEFTAENNFDSNLEYARTGGCFVTTKKAIAFVVIAILALIAVGAFVYFYGKDINKKEEELTADIEKLINESINNANKQKRLPAHITPLHYRLRIHPYLDEHSEKNFTFSGQVRILIISSQSTNQIVLNSEFLDINKDDIQVFSSTKGTLRSLSKIVKREIAEPQETHLNNDTKSIENGAVQPVNSSPTSTDIHIPPKTDTSKTVASNSTTSSVTNNSVPRVKGLEITSNAPDEMKPNLSTTRSPHSQATSTATKNIKPTPTATASTLPETTLSVSNNSEPKLSTSSPTLPEWTSSATKRLNPIGVFTPTPLSTETITLPSEPPGAATIESVTRSVLPDTREIKPEREKTINIGIKSHELDPENGLLIINLAERLKPGVNYSINVKFSGKISNNLVGLYETSYLGHDKQVKWLLSTHLQPVFARRVFPCFDEPSFKSVFKISIARRTDMTILSNMPWKDSEPLIGAVGWVWDHFEESPRMPSYLVAFTVFDFKHSEPSFPEIGPTFKIWAPKEKLYDARYAIEISPKIFSYLQNYFGVNYPLSKIDLVALPELAQEATDNWGIILFRDSSLLISNTTNSWKIENNIFKTIVRKLSTQWFGNLVTMNWWSEMWLIEGFSTFMQDVVENEMKPVPEDLDSFPLRITQAILDTDQLKSVRSLHGEIEQLNQIEQLFDDVAINKGSCVIRMLNYTLGEDLFKKGVQNYLRNWAYKCSDEDSFWDSFTELSKGQTIFPSNLTVKEFMNSWIKQEGYPVVTVIRNYMNGNAVINQSRFVQSDVTYDTLWYIPLTYTIEDDIGAKSTLWLEKEKSLTVLNLTTIEKDVWIVFNTEQAGFYRVNYDTRNWNLIQKQLIKNHTKILPSNRGQLLNDAFELAYAGLLDYQIAFELTKYLEVERNYRPWHSVYNSLRSLEYVLASTHYNGAFQDYIIKIAQPTFKEMNFPSLNHTKHGKLLKTFMVQVSCSVKYQPCVNWAKESFQRWMNSPKPDVENLIEFDVRESVQCTAIKAGEQIEWDFLWERTRYPYISSADMKIAYASLGCTQEPWIINSYLERSLNGSIGVQYVPEVWKSISHPVGLRTGFSFIRENWERIYERFHDNIPVITAIFEEFLSKLSTSVDLEDLTSFYKLHKNNLQPVSTLMLNVVDRIKQRVYWSKTHLETVSTWLLNN